MRTPFHRTALFVVLSSLTAVFLAACSSTESVSERRRRTERDSALSTEAPLADDSFWEESGDAGLANGDAGGSRSTGASTDDGFEGLFGDEEEAPAPTPRETGRRAAGAATARAAGGDAADDLLRDLASDAEIKREAARYHVRAGDEALERRRNEEARDAYRRALELDPANSEAEAKLNEVLVLLGERRGERAIGGDDILTGLEVERQFQK
ncbi:MAG TPA: hypothetical protein VK116_00735, partial [Planctomycetota bacterium]|nr:hypothetical protein [Planctomycetota bacterium]